jgi:hypothetical protein
VGTFIVLIAYMFLQMGTLKPDGLLYSLLNLGGAAMLLISLSYTWNLAAVVMEVTWLIISAYGAFKGFSAYKAERLYASKNRSF